MLKKILIILLLVIVSIFNIKKPIQEVFSEKINIKVDNQEIGITFIYSNQNKLLLISDSKINILLILEYKNKFNIYKYFNINKIDYIISKNNINIKMKYINKIILKNKTKIKDIIFETSNWGINVYYENNILNIIDGKKTFRNKDIINGRFIYIYNFNKNHFINLNDNIEVLFYNRDDYFSNRFLEHIYTIWLDTYMIQPNEYTTLKIGKDNFKMITIPIIN